MTATAEQLFGTAEVARLLGVTTAAIQMAELRGSIPRAPRDPGSRDRVYTLEDIARLRDYFQR